jgi:hypothetical protein
MMNPEIKAKWLAALRSGDYKQGYNQLTTVNGNDVSYCCLGVLCDIAKSEGVVESKLSSRKTYLKYGKGQNSDNAYLPKAVSAWAGLDENAHPANPMLLSGDYLGTLNDQDNLDFPAIADRIESGL